MGGFFAAFAGGLELMRMSGGWGDGGVSVRSGSGLVEALRGLAFARLGRRRVLRGLALALGLVGLVACVGGGKQAQGPSVQLVAATYRPTGEEVITTRQDTPGRFFSCERQRDTCFSGNAVPRLGQPGASGGPTGYIDTSALNTPGNEGAASEFQMEVDREDIVVEPLRSQQIIGGQWQAELETGGSIRLNYDNEPLERVAQDILGGILGVNYLLGEGMTGTVTFRSEKRFTRAEVLQVLADILARNGYLIQYFNSVYHVGLPEELDTLTGLRGRTAIESDETYVIALRSTAPENIAEIVAALIPPGNTVSAVPESNNLLVRGDPSQFQAIEGLVQSLSGTGASSNILAIIPLRRSSPEVVADQLSQIYAERNLGDVLFVPLEQRQGILVVTDRGEVVDDVRQLATSLDVELRDTAKLRVVQLTYLNAEETAAQLQNVFSGGAPGRPVQDAPQPGFDSAIVRSAIDRASGDDGDVTSPPPPAIDPAAATAASAAAPPVELGSGVTIAADARNNALLVRSTYAEFKRIAAAVKALDIPLAQVVIEATIVEVDINDSLQYGVQAFLQRNGDTFRSAPVTGAADPGGAGFSALLSSTRGSTNIQLVLTALQSVSNVKVISSPYLTVTDGATSRLSVGDQIPFVTASQTSSSDGSVTVTKEVETRDVGVILEVTPKIAPDNSVILDIVQEVSSARNENTAAGDNPVVSQRRLESRITVQSGSTILLGGLIQERSETTRDAVPVVSKIPILGEAFKQTDDTQNRSELLVLITPRVVRNSSQVTDLTDQLRYLMTTR
jgi:general secretion pathway protein D